MRTQRAKIHWFYILTVIVFCAILLIVKWNSEIKEIQHRVDMGYELTEADQTPQMIKLGLDLAGGVDLLYKAVPPPGTARVTKEQMDGLVEIVRRRIDPQGVKEPIVQQIGDNRLNIQIPGETDPEAVEGLLEQTAMLQFIDTGDKPIPEGDIIKFLGEDESSPEIDDTETAESDDEITTEEMDEEDERVAPVREPEVHYYTTDKVIIEGSQLRSAYSDIGDMGQSVVSFVLDREGGRIFGEHTARNIGKHLTITLDGNVISSPVINTSIPHGRGMISGNFTRREAYELAILLRSGALPVSLEKLSSRAVGPTLGRESIEMSIKAAFFGLICLMIYIIIFYRLVGLMADLALLLYAGIFLSLISIMGVTLTLPGIAGFILSLGMAVDANVIIFERIKEELNSGKTYLAGIEAGFERAWPAILDANVTTMITGLVLYMVGSGPIKGFAVVLILGILVSMFTALIITRSFIALWSSTESLQKPFFFGFGVKKQTEVTQKTR